MADISAIHKTFRRQCPRVRAFSHVCNSGRIIVSIGIVAVLLFTKCNLNIYANNKIASWMIFFSNKWYTALSLIDLIGEKHILYSNMPQSTIEATCIYHCGNKLIKATGFL